MEIELNSGYNYILSHIDKGSKLYFNQGILLHFLVPSVSESIYLGFGLSINNKYNDKTTIEQDSIKKEITETIILPQILISLQFNTHRQGLSPVFGYQFILYPSHLLEHKALLGINYQIKSFSFKLYGDIGLFVFLNKYASTGLNVGLSYLIK